MTISELLLQELQKVCPVTSVAIGNPKDKASWVATFAPEATPGQKFKAREVIVRFPTLELIRSMWGDKTARLDQEIKAVCPISGVSVGRMNDKDTWQPSFLPSATTQEKAAAMEVIEQFDIFTPDPVKDLSDLDNHQGLKRLAVAISTVAGLNIKAVKAAFRN